MGLVLMSVRFQIMMEMVRFFPYTKDLHIRDEGNELTCKIIMNPYTGLIATFLLWDYLHGVVTKKEAERASLILTKEQAEKKAATEDKAQDDRTQEHLAKSRKLDLALMEQKLITATKKNNRMQEEETETKKKNWTLDLIEKNRAAAFKVDQKRLEKEKKDAAVAEEKRCTLFLNTEAQILVDTEARDAEVQKEVNEERKLDTRRKRDREDKTQADKDEMMEIEKNIKKQKLIEITRKNQNQGPVVQGVAMEQDSDDDDEEMGY